MGFVYHHFHIQLTHRVATLRMSGLITYWSRITVCVRYRILALLDGLRTTELTLRCKFLARNSGYPESIHYYRWMTALSGCLPRWSIYKPKSCTPGILEKDNTPRWIFGGLGVSFMRCGLGIVRGLDTIPCLYCSDYIRSRKGHHYLKISKYLYLPMIFSGDALLWILMNARQPPRCANIHISLLPPQGFLVASFKDFPQLFPKSVKFL